MNKISVEYLRSILDYDKNTGIFRWKVKKSRRNHIGDVAGIVHRTGYRVITIDRVMLPEHRLAWIHVFGSLDDVILDHINGIRSDNRIDNLRISTPSENLCNQERHREGRLVGTTLDRRANGFISQCWINGRKYFFGRFKTEIEAHNAFLEGKRMILEGMGENVQGGRK